MRNKRLLNEDVLRRAAAECLQNAIDLLREGKLLAVHGSGARATALAVIGVEEFAKAVLYTVAALLPAQRRFLPRKITDHHLKHLIAISVEGAHAMTDEAESPGDLVDVFVTLAGMGVSGLVKADRPPSEFFSEIESEVPGWVMSPNRKNVALYVEVTSDGDILTPARAEDWATDEVLGLEWYAEAFHELPGVLRDDGRWIAFADCIRGRLARS